MRKLLLICVGLAVLGGFFTWSHYRKIDPAAAEAAVQQQPATTAQSDGKPSDGKPRVAVKVATVEESTMPIRRRTIGWVEPIATVAIKSRIDSVITEQKATDGQFVSAGDVLFILDDREARAAIARDEAAMAQHQAEVERTLADLARVKTLASKQTASKQTLDQAISDARVAESVVAADRAVLQADLLTLSYTTITAPIAGRLGSVAVTPGNLVEANGDVLVTITQMQPIRVTFTLPDRDIDALRTALAQYPPAVVRVFVKGSDVARAKGHLSFIDSTVDSASGTISAKAEFENENLALWPGQYLDTEIELGLLPRTAVVPSVALQVGQDGLFVFVVTPDDTVEVRKVTVAGNDGGKSAIAEGLQPGERVVVDGQHQIGPGSRVMIVD